MARIKNAVLDTGPLTHLGRISSLKVFRIFQGILLSEDVARELGDASRLPANCKLAKLEGRAKDMSKLIMEEYGLGAGESTAIALAKRWVQLYRMRACQVIPVTFLSNCQQMVK